MVNNKKVCVIGLGYIGLPTACVFAKAGYKVHGYDVSPQVISAIQQNQCHLNEPGLAELLNQVIQSGYFSCDTSPDKADIFIIAVPTPLKDDRTPDLSYIQAVATQIAPFLEKGNLIILESTSPVGTTEQLNDWLREQRPDLNFPEHKEHDADIQLAYCPERIIPGKSLQELYENDRIIGGLTKQSAKTAAEFYNSILLSKCLLTDTRTAELCKLAENTFRDVNIALANEFSLICDTLNIDVWELIHLANHHPRVNFLTPGCGVGGHCIAVDPWFITNSCPEQSKLIHTARQVNDNKPKYIIEKIAAELEAIEQPKITCLGLAFKADTEDLRESPALEIALSLAKKGYDLSIVEPNIDQLPVEFSSLNNVKLINLDDTESDSHLTVMLVNHQAFKNRIWPNLMKFCQ